MGCYSHRFLTISQLVYFIAQHKASATPAIRHSKDREPPLPVYLGQKMHTLMRSKEIVSTLYDFGMSVSYDYVMELESSPGSVACKLFEDEGLGCPAHLRKEQFIVGALDNIDHNLSSTTAQGSFPWSWNQHVPIHHC